MSTYNLDPLFAPRSVAIVGASSQPCSLGEIILGNLKAAGFAGPIYLVAPDHQLIEGLCRTADYAALPEPPDVAVLTVPPSQLADVITAVGARGTAAAIIMAADLGDGPGSMAAAAERAARTTGLRLIGPHCFGAMIPGQGFNASLARRLPQNGELALISQSGAIAAGVAEWAVQRSIGFSAIVSIGHQLDVDAGDLLDYFAVDRHTRAILLYLESIKNARKFMSAAGAAARAKPVIVIKAGRHGPAARGTATAMGALAGSDAVFAAAFHRAGLLRVGDLDHLLSAAEALARTGPCPGNRLAILTNGHGMAVLATDELITLGGRIAELSPEACRKLDAVLPPAWSRGNPVDMLGDANAERYAAALQVLLADRQNDAVLVIHVPTALADSAVAACRVADVVRAQRTVKIVSPDLARKSEVDGVRLNLMRPEAVRSAARDILEKARALRPQARITGLSIHPMVVRPTAHQLLAGIIDDPTFGPIIGLARSGPALELSHALALPPQDMKLSSDLIARARIAGLPITARNEAEVALLLTNLSQLLADVPEIRELEMDPLLVDETGVLAIDARVVVAAAEPKFKGSRHQRFAIRPYPSGSGP